MGQQEVATSSSRALPRAQAGACARGKVHTVGHKGWVQQGARYTAPAAEQESRKLQEEPRGKSRAEARFLHAPSRPHRTTCM